jgi:hypothetical protein
MLFGQSRYFNVHTRTGQLMVGSAVKGFVSF